MFIPPNREEARTRIAELVSRFREQYASYKRPDYNETQVRRDFIDPFFKALGWDIDNSAGNAEAYREVIHEDRVKVGKALKAPDYSFRLEGGKRLFFVEAKKPNVRVKSEVEPAYQVRRYAWSAKLPVSILTDFEEFSVYDCSKRPNAEDKASVARIKYLTFEDYDKEFDYLWDTFSKEQVRKGGFDRFVKSDRGKRGTATVDDAFLESLDTWRKYLATSISLRNHDLEEEDLNHVVQQTIDRIIFLRIAEDRGVEPYGELMAAIREGGELYSNLFKLFRRADTKYNSGLFDFRKDKRSATIAVDNKVVRNIVEDLYYPKSPYEFSVLSVEILGSAYEQFLGKRIRIDAGHRARIEEKPEVRKAGGVYYTPQYIVDYIVERTVGDLVKGRTPKEVKELKVLDPACGSGSFLLGAYQFLLDWHKRYYREHAPAKGTKRDAVLRPDGELTSAVKKEILLNNIHGVDLDPNAVEVTKLSLLLKCMEGETTASIQHSLDFAQERILPTLDENVLCGNSLISTDFYDGMLDYGDERTIKPFNWNKEFKRLFDRPSRSVSPQDEIDEYNARVKSTLAALEEERKALGNKFGTGVSEPTTAYGRKTRGEEAVFDAVIGNPPYVQQAMYESFDERQKEYLLANYSSSMGRMNTFGFFIEKGIRLLRPGGRLGFIVPNTVLTQEYYKPLRRYVLDHARMKEIVTYEKPPFADAVVEAVTLLIEKAPTRKAPVTITNVDKDRSLTQRTIPISLYLDDPQIQFSVEADEGARNIRKVIDGRSDGKLGDISDINQAIALKGDRAAYLHDRPKGKDYKPVLDGREIQRYRTQWSGKYLRYDINAIHSCKREDIFLSPKKIFFRRVSASLIATLDDQQFYALNTLVAINLKQGVDRELELILGLFNSKLWNFYYTRFLKSTKKVFSEIQARSIAQLPLPRPDKTLEAEIVKHVRSLLEVVPQAAQNNTPAQLQRRIEHMEQRVDEAVYALFGLNEDEIAIVEGSLNPTGKP